VFDSPGPQVTATSNGSQAEAKQSEHACVHRVLGHEGCELPLTRRADADEPFERLRWNETTATTGAGTTRRGMERIEHDAVP